MTEKILPKIKPCYREYNLAIDTLFIGFRRVDVDAETKKFWEENFSNVAEGETVGFAITDCLRKLGDIQKDYPQFDFYAQALTH